MTGDTGAAERIQALRDRLIEASLPHVPFDGWTLRALAAGAADIGLGIGEVHAAFPDPARNSVSHLAEWTDRRMLERLAGTDLDSLRTRERVSLAIRLRLELLAAHREAVRHAIGFLSLPGNQLLGLGCACRSVDGIWHAVGDRSTDFSYYTKRGLLAGVLLSTTLFWLDDDSDGFADTAAFLDRRIADIMRIPEIRGRLRRIIPKPRFRRSSRRG